MGKEKKKSKSAVSEPKSKKDDKKESDKKPAALESAMTDATSGRTQDPTTGSVAPTTTASVAPPVVMVGGKKMAVMVMYKGKKASRTMMRELLGKKKDKKDTERSEFEPTTASMAGPMPLRRVGKLTDAQMVLASLLFTLSILGLLLVVVGAVLYVTRKQ